MTSCLQNDELCTPHILTSQGSSVALVVMVTGKAVKGARRAGAQGAKCKEASLSEGYRCGLGTYKRGLLAFCALCASLASPNPGPAARLSFFLLAGVQTAEQKRAQDVGSGSRVHCRRKQCLLEV